MNHNAVLNSINTERILHIFHHFAIFTMHAPDPISYLVRANHQCTSFKWYEMFHFWSPTEEKSWHSIIPNKSLVEKNVVVKVNLLILCAIQFSCHFSVAMKSKLRAFISHITDKDFDVVATKVIGHLLAEFSFIRCYEFQINFIKWLTVSNLYRGERENDKHIPKSMGSPFQSKQMWYCPVFCSVLWFLSVAKTQSHSFHQTVWLITQKNRCNELCH